MYLPQIFFLFLNAGFLTIQAQQCNLRGTCVDADLVSIHTTKTPLECLKDCQSMSEDCKWFTFTFSSYDTEDNCWLLRNCNDFQEQNYYYVSGESFCPSDFCEMVGTCQVTWLTFLGVLYLLGVKLNQYFSRVLSLVSFLSIIRTWIGVIPPVLQTQNANIIPFRILKDIRNVLWWKIAPLWMKLLLILCQARLDVQLFIEINTLREIWRGLRDSFQNVATSKGRQVR